MLLFDENLSPRLSKLIGNAFPGSKHVKDFDLESASDEQICTCAVQNKLTIVTQDNDFINRSSIKGHPPKIIHIAIGNSTTAQICKLLLTYSKNIQSFLENPEESYFIID